MARAIHLLAGDRARHRQARLPHRSRRSAGPLPADREVLVRRDRFRVDRTYAVGLERLKPGLPLSLRAAAGTRASAVAGAAVIWFLFAGSIASSKLPAVLRQPGGARWGFAILFLLAAGAVPMLHAA